MNGDSLLAVKLGTGKHCEPVMIGPSWPLRIIAPFGASRTSDLLRDWKSHTTALVGAGVDAIQELSTVGDYARYRDALVEASPVPYGTVLTYELTTLCESRRNLSQRDLNSLAIDVLQSQIEHGIDYVTIHAALSRGLLLRTQASRARRAIPIPSRAASMLIRLMKRLDCENPFYEVFSTISELCASRGVAISLGASLRPAAISDALDECHLEELGEQQELCNISRSHGTHLLLEGLSHAIPDDLKNYCRLAKELCPNAATTALGPLPTDIAAGADHIAAAIGVTMGRLSGLDSVNVITPKEHLAMPTARDMIEGIRAAKIGAYIAEVIKGGKNTNRDRLMSEARNALDWSTQLQHSLLPDLFAEIVKAESLVDQKSCAICESKCPLLAAEKVSRDL